MTAEGLADPSLPLDVVVLSESDSGVSTAERVSVQIGQTLQLFPQFHFYSVIAVRL